MRIALALIMLSLLLTAPVLAKGQGHQFCHKNPMCYR